MNFGLTEEQEMVRETIAQCLDEVSSGVRVALPSGRDAEMWRGLAELGAIAMRLPQAADGMGMRVFQRTRNYPPARASLIPISSSRAAGWRKRSASCIIPVSSRPGNVSSVRIVAARSMPMTSMIARA